jgi:cyclomaltodextrinase
MPSPGRALYHLHSLGAAGVAPVNPDVDAADPCDRGFRVLHGWLDHIVELGGGGVLLTPVFVSSTHGYDTVDPFRIDQRLGDDHDFDAFVEACHSRGLEVILDGVFNHVGRDHAAFRDVLAHGEASTFAEWFRLDFSRDDGDGFTYRTFDGHRELVALNHRSDAVLDWAEAVACHWLDRGVDGWRLDVAYAMPVPFLKELTDRVHRQHPEAFIFGEMIHGDYAGFVSGTGLDSVTQYELYKAVWSSLNDANFFELAWALERHRALTPGFAPVTFVGNHDVTRIASQLHDPSHLAHAVTLLFTVPGVPCIYYGDELAWRGTKENRPGGDDAIRQALPPSAEPADEQQTWMRNLYQQLIALRRDRPWLTQGDIEVLDTASERITYTVRAGDNALLVTLDSAGSAVMPPPGWQPIASYPGIAICERLANVGDPAAT